MGSSLSYSMLDSTTCRFFACHASVLHSHALLLIVHWPTSRVAVLRDGTRRTRTKLSIVFTKVVENQPKSSQDQIGRNDTTRAPHHVTMTSTILRPNLPQTKKPTADEMERCKRRSERETRWRRRNLAGAVVLGGWWSARSGNALAKSCLEQCVRECEKIAPGSGGYWYEDGNERDTRETKPNL